MTIYDLFQIKGRRLKGMDQDGQFSDGLMDHYTCLYNEPYFRELLSFERKRCERTRRPFFLMLVEVQSIEDAFERHQIIKKICKLLSSATRNTDVKGWYIYSTVMGVIFTDTIDTANNMSRTYKNLTKKCTDVIRDGLEKEEFERILLTWHIFPGQFDKAFTDYSGYTTMYPDIIALRAKKKSILFWKRFIDIFVSSVLITFLFPLFVVIALLIRITSPGPALFKQERVGLFGKRFSLFKFRTMFNNNDTTIHQEFVKNLIAGSQDRTRSEQNSSHTGVYKIVRDPRVTPLGRLLRMTSLDELPQFYNVLKGDMSLVGPRPPIPYECEKYDIWHRKRVLWMKPGITGPWQVYGRSKTTFDEMVRMDIRYIQEWSLWMDIKILIQTPWVVFACKGGY